jgi:hypothetical protein
VKKLKIWLIGLALITFWQWPPLLIEPGHAILGDNYIGVIFNIGDTGIVAFKPLWAVSPDESHYVKGPIEGKNWLPKVALYLNASNGKLFSTDGYLVAWLMLGFFWLIQRKVSGNNDPLATMAEKEDQLRREIDCQYEQN